MNPTANNTAFDRAADSLLSILSPDQAHRIIDFHADAEMHARIEVLAHKANEGELTDEERAEYEGYAQANRFIAVLQAKARR